MKNTLEIMNADIQAALAQKLKAQKLKKNSPNNDNHLIEKADKTQLDDSQLSRVIEMAWEDRTPFSAIEHNYGLSETDVIELMRREIKPSSFKLWRKRVTGRQTKHEAMRGFSVGRAYCKTQYKPR